MALPRAKRHPDMAEGPAVRGRALPPWASVTRQEPYAARMPARSVLVIERLLEVPLHWG